MDETSIISCLKEQSACTSRKLAYTAQLFAQEEFLRRLSHKKKRDDFVLTGLYSVFGRLDFPQKVSIPLEFQIRRQDNLTEFIKNQIEEIIESENLKLNQKLISLKTLYIKEKRDFNNRDIIQVQVIGQIQRIKIPFIIKFYIMEDNVLRPKDITYKSQIHEFEEHVVLTNRLEVIVAQCLIGILKRKELTDSLQEIYIIYQIGSNFSVNGRRITDQLRISKEKNESWFQQSDFAQIVQVEPDRQHKIKWKQFCNVAGQKETDFKEITNLVYSFLEPTWKALFSEVEFFGDWMPELKRYLG